jgi:hypothetical protein
MIDYPNLELYADELCEATTLGELLMLTLLLCYEFGEDSTIKFDAGHNNISVFIHPEHRHE